MSPGARTMPAAMVLPTAAAMPNHMPRTLRRPPRERAEVEVAPGRGEPNGGVSVVVLDASIVLDNGVSGELAATPP
jgi:vacuolar-type H+-ATPase subunit E/Vma4